MILTTAGRGEVIGVRSIEITCSIRLDRTGRADNRRATPGPTGLGGTATGDGMFVIYTPDLRSLRREGDTTPGAA